MPENLNASVDRAEALRPLIPDGMSMPELALRFILANSDVSTIIPGMRSLKNVQANMGHLRRPGAANRVARRTPFPPLGPPADGMVAVASCHRSPWPDWVWQVVPETGGTTNTIL